jgi:hypothetical protein
MNEATINKCFNIDIERKGKRKGIIQNYFQGIIEKKVET